MLGNLRAQFRYNSRILLANSYWMLIIPLVASQLVISWHMAVATLVKADTVAKTAELVIPLLAAFMCAHLVTPEHRHRVDEIAFVRRRPVLWTIALRLIALYTITALLALVMLYVYKKGLKLQFDLTKTLLACIPSTLFLSMLSMAFAGAWRTPAAGIGAALVYFAADAARGAALNPLFTLHAYSAALVKSGDGTANPQWMLSKAALLVMAVVAAWAGTRCLGRPASPRRWRAGLRVAYGTLAFAFLYLAAGAGWQFAQARRAEATHPEEALQAYQRGFSGFGSIPAAYLFGPDFAAYVGVPAKDPDDPKYYLIARANEPQRLRALAARWPDSRWADNALFEVIRLSGGAEKNRSSEPEAAKQALLGSRQFLDRYPTSSFAPAAALRLVRAAHRVGDEKTMMWAYQRATEVYADSAVVSDASAELEQFYLEHGKVNEAIAAARVSVDKAPPETRADALLNFAGFLAQIGHKQEARAAYAEVEKAVDDKLVALGLKVLDANSVTEETIRRRQAIIALRTQAREGAAVLDAK